MWNQGFAPVGPVKDPPHTYKQKHNGQRLTIND